KSSFSDSCASGTDGAQLRSIIIASCKASEIRFISVKSRCDGQISETYRDRGVYCSGNCCVFVTSLWVMNPDAYFTLVQSRYKVVPRRALPEMRSADFICPRP